MRKRVVTSLILLPALAFAWLGGIWLQVILGILSLMGMTEIYKAMSSKRETVHYLGYVFAVSYYCILPFITRPTYFFMLITAFIMALSIYMVVFHSKINMVDCAVALYGFFYVAFLMSFVYLVRMYPNPQTESMGRYFVWLIFICSFGCDTLSLFSGKAFGKRQLAPNLSPKKTVEGAAGGVAGATLLAFVYGIIISKVVGITSFHIVLYFTIIGAVGAVFSIFGDLAASAVKRLKKIKDFGEIFPGHGGVMDRFDGMVFTAPVVYILMVVIMWKK
ncbi:MAG: phosphatidate cytidylyltransferase [Defluviitaleaceae bacterium]|nr:phosphatidate cytidylyltransferase [Defluviitaleaceae bacterium]